MSILQGLFDLDGNVAGVAVVDVFGEHDAVDSKKDAVLENAGEMRGRSDGENDGDLCL